MKVASLKRAKLDIVLSHCTRKTLGLFLENEIQEKKAYGMLLVKKIGDSDAWKITDVIPLYKNCRETDGKLYMDDLMTRFAIPSTTPFEKRGWFVDKGELADILYKCNANNLEIIGSYHMHRVPWEHDSVRDTPTLLDKILAEDTGLLMMIISTVDINNPKARIFYEGNIEKEVQINII